MDTEPPGREGLGKERPSSISEGTGKPGKFFYGWWVLGAATMAQTVQSAVFNVGAAALFLPVAREFNTTRTVISGAFAASRLEGGFTGPLEGYLIHWIGPRRYMMAGWVIFGLGLITIGLSQSILHFYGAFLLATLGQSVAGFLPIVTVLVNWFQRWRGRAIAVYQLGNSFAAMLVPLVAWFILNAGWRETVIGLGIITILIGVPLAAMMRARPEDYGYLPDGAQPREAALGSPESPASRPESPPASGQSDTTVGQALRSRSFWFLGSSHAVTLTAWGALRVHLIPSLVDIGLEEQTAANVFSAALVIAGAGRLIGGFLADYLGTRKVLVTAILVQAGSVVFLAFASTLTHALIFAAFFGVAFGARGTLMTVLRGEVFGRTNFSRLAGLMDPISTVGVVVSPIFAGYLYDTLGNYRVAYMTIAVLSTMGAALLFGIRIPKSPESQTSPVQDPSTTSAAST